jgi:outer membrane protein, heavy metal efflux system
VGATAYRIKTEFSMNRKLTLLMLWILTILPNPPTQAGALDPVSSHSSSLTFSAALRLAEQNTPILRARAIAVKAADFELEPAAELPDPQLVLGLNNVPATGPDRGHLGQDFMTMQRIGIMQNVPNRSTRKARVALAKAQIVEAEAELTIERARVLHDAAKAWLDCYFLEHRLPLFDELEQDLRLLTKVSQAQLAANTGNTLAALDPAKQSAELADIRDDTYQKLAAARARLQSLIGDDTDMPLGGTSPALAIDPSQIREHLHRHPKLALYEPLTSLAEARLQTAEADRQANWSIGVDYQHREAPFDDMVSLELRFDLPVFPATRQNPRIAAERSRLRALQLEREAMLRDHAADLTSDLAIHRSVVRQLNRITSTWLPLAEQGLALAMAGYRAGQQEFTTTLSERRNLINVRLRELDLQHQRAVLAAKLIYAYGAPQQ